MNSIKRKIKNKMTNFSVAKDVFRNEQGAIDLASIMVGIIVIGLIGGVIAATVFAIIPWSQDNAAKQQLDSIASAQHAYMGLASDPSSTLPAGAARNSYADSAKLESASLLKSADTYCTSPSKDGKSFSAYAKSSTGTVWSITSKNTKPQIFTNIIPAACTSLDPYIDPMPKTTILTYRCDTAITGSLPISGTLLGKETWSDGLSTFTYTTGGEAMRSRTFNAGVTYTATFEGTYTRIMSNSNADTTALNKCLRSIDHLGSETGVTQAVYGFYGASNLTEVPDHIPTTITSAARMFEGATQLNDSSISNWNTSNIWNMGYMFYGATALNQDLSNWNVESVTARSNFVPAGYNPTHLPAFP